MPRGGRRVGAGRPRGSATKRTRAVANAAAELGHSPLSYMLDVLANPKTSPARRDRMAENCAPYMHPKLNAVATVDASAKPCPPLELKIFSVPRGAQIVDGQIVWPDGTPATAEETKFEPFKASDFPPALPSPEPAPVEPLSVIELEAEADDKIERLDSWRRRSDGDDESGAA